MLSSLTMADKPRLTQRMNLVLLVLNVIGAIIYVVRASSGWAIPGEPVTGEPFVWAIAILPVCAVFFVLNVTWGALILYYRQWRGGRFWLFAAFIWLVASAVDFAHH